MRYKVKGHPNLYKDSHSKAVISTDHQAVEKYKIARQQKKIHSDEINSLKAEIQEMKDILNRLLEERNKG